MTDCKTGNCGSDRANKSIACTVTQCAYHCVGENYCSLDKVQIASHETNPTQDKCVDCKSFQLKG